MSKHRIPRPLGRTGSALAASALVCLSCLSCGAPATTKAPDAPTSTATPATTKATRDAPNTEGPAATPAAAKGAPSTGWEGRYLTSDAGVAVNPLLRCPIEGGWLTLQGGKLKFTLDISAVDDAVEPAAAPAVLSVVAPVPADGNLDQVVPLPPETLALIKPHKGKMARVTAVHVVGKFVDVDSAREGTGKMGSVLVGAVGFAKGEGEACGFGLTREDYQPPAASPAAPEARCSGRKSHESCIGDSACCSHKCVNHGAGRGYCL